MMKFRDVKVGDVVTRMLAGTIPMKLRVQLNRQLHCTTFSDQIRGMSFATELPHKSPH
jgi:hypothetical protein